MCYDHKGTMKQFRRLKSRVIHVIPACRSCRFIFVILAFVLFTEIVIFHGLVIYAYFQFKENFTPLYDPNKQTLIEKFGTNKFARNIIFSAKYGGLSSVLQDTVERIYITYPKGNKNISLSTFKLDTSHSGEFLYLYRRILSRKSFLYKRLIVDIGANDGFLSSNSFNFIQHGWNGILVEPLSEQLHLARYHLTRYIDEYNDKKQFVQYVEAVLGISDGAVKLVVSPDLASMESHVLSEKDYDGSKKRIRTVKGMSVNTFIQEYDIPQYFGILSIDAEGLGNKDTVERIYITYPKGNKNISLSTFKLDTSHSGEFLYLYRRILSRKSFLYKRLIVDIGANDGFLSSNSFNFIQHGWNGILVEPLSEQLHLARYHLTRYIDEYNDKKQFVQYVEAVLGISDGAVKLVVSPDLASMESHVLSEKDYDGSKKRIRTVKGMSVNTFIQEYDIPQYFGILSIDAEGLGNKILHQFIEMKCRPAYIIYEDLHEKQEETGPETVQYLMKVGYKYLTTRGWNLLFEYTKR